MARGLVAGGGRVQNPSRGELLTRHIAMLRRARRGLVPIIVPFVGLVALSMPAAADLGGHDDNPQAESEGLVASTTNPSDSKGSVPPPDADHEVCVRYLSSALTLTFTGDENADGVDVGSKTYNTAPTAPVLAEVRGDTPDRYDGPKGSYLSSEGDGDGCHTASAGVTPLTFDTSAPGGIVTFVGAADAQLESLSCFGGSDEDTFQRGGTAATLRLELHDVECTITDLTDRTTASETFDEVTLEAKIRAVAGVNACVGPIAPNGCELEWAFSDLG